MGNKIINVGTVVANSQKIHSGRELQTGESAQKLWESLPSVYRQCVVIYTDFYSSYPVVLPSKRHRAVGKETGKTNYIERFNYTLRQRVSRVVRKTLSFSKKLENYIGAICNFIHHYNTSLPSCASFPLRPFLFKTTFLFRF
jgi:insertion element IS1 protein InsB